MPENNKQTRPKPKPLMWRKLHAKMSPTHLRMMEVLSDGGYHRLAELHQCLADELSSVGTVHYHLSTLRVILRREGKTVAYQSIDGLSFYRLVAVPETAQATAPS